MKYYPPGGAPTDCDLSVCEVEKRIGPIDRRSPPRGTDRRIRTNEKRKGKAK